MTARATSAGRAQPVLLTTAACLAAVYLGVLGWLKWHEVEMVYRPVAELQPVASDLGLRPERLQVAGADGTRHLLWVYRTRPATDAPWVIFLHGNGANVSTPMNVARCHQLTLLGLNVVAVEYPGYGGSPGTPSERGMVAAGTAAWTWLTEAIGVPDRRIAIYGWSLGSGAATQVAADVGEGALILEGAFTSVADVAADAYPLLPVRWLLRDPFASADRIARTGSPLLLLHARDDEIVPFSHGERLHAAARGPRQLVPLTGGHIYLNLVREDDYLAAVHAFLGTALGVGLQAPPRSLVLRLLAAAEGDDDARAAALALVARVRAGELRGYNAASYALGHAARRWRTVDPAGADTLLAKSAGAR